MSPASAAWTDLGGSMLVRQSVEFAMNSVLLLHPEETIVVDPGVVPDELDDLAATTAKAGAQRTTLFFTHAHWDHVLGRPWWPGARTIAHDRFAGELRREREKILREAEAAAERRGQRWTRGFEPFRPDESVSGLRFEKRGPWQLVFRDAYGHSDSQLTLHLPDRRVLIAADMLSDLEIPWLDREAAAYLRTLETLQPLAHHGAIETLIPGHGAIARGRDAVLARLDADLGYLRALESGARAAMAERDPVAACRALAGPRWEGPPIPESMRSVHEQNVKLACEGVAVEERHATRINAVRENGPPPRR
jgi:glyoxylase-like metal-dependent hydrolase (beta-lactamase superfamily II)